jgi:hypothetical protein
MNGLGNHPDATAGEEAAGTVIAVERAALGQWSRKDPSGFPEIFDSDAVYFDPYLERRIDGLEALTQYVEGIRGQACIDRFEWIDLQTPCFDRFADQAIRFFYILKARGSRS